MPAKWGSQVAHQQQNQLQLQQQQHQANQSKCRIVGDKRTSHVEFDDSLAVFGQPEEQSSSKPTRGRIAGYLATKLSNLANLGGQQHQQQQAGGCSSAPPSPLHKTRNASQQLFGQWRRAGSPSCVSLSREFSGCDFILLLDSAGQSHNSPLVIHLVAPNLQEKAAWMSDISQVSFKIKLFSPNAAAYCSRAFLLNPSTLIGQASLILFKSAPFCHWPLIQRLILFYSRLPFGQLGRWATSLRLGQVCNLTHRLCLRFVLRQQAYKYVQ